jgi:hypothetical protein
MLGRGGLERVGGRAGVHGADEVLVVGGGGEHDDGGPVRRVELGDPIADMGLAGAGMRGGRVESGAGVAHGQLDVPVLAGHRHGKPAPPGMDPPCLRRMMRRPPPAGTLAAAHATGVLAAAHATGVTVLAEAGSGTVLIDGLASPTVT